MSELKPCPFCGGEAYVSNGVPRLWYVHCPECIIDGPINNTEAKAIEAWNRRAQPAQAGQVLSEEEMLRAILPLCHNDTVARLLVENSGDEYRAIEAAVLAKRVPMTESAWQNPLHPDQISDRPIPNWTPLYRLMSKISDPSNAQHFSAEAAAKAFGIVGEKGGAT